MRRDALPCVYNMIVRLYNTSAANGMVNIVTEIPITSCKLKATAIPCK